MLLRFAGFAGENRALHPILLPPGVGVASLNQRPGRGDLRPWRAPLAVASVAANSQTIYRMGRSAPSDSAYWLAWPGDVDVARGFNANDSTERTFWTGDGVPKWTDNTIGLAAPPYPDSSGVRVLGVPAPNATPSLSEQVAGTGDDETRVYVVTWVNDKSEESAPSAPVSITTKPGATIRVTRNATVPTGAYGIATWRIYRTAAGNENDYYFVGEAPAATAFVDDVGTLNFASSLQSESWSMPPADLKGLKALWNGIMCGFVGKSIRFSEQFRPFAWPEEYELIVDDDIVALGRWRQQLVVLTVGKPFIVTGSSPDSMSLQMMEMNQSCVSKRGVVELGHGVAWPSPDGLAYIGDGGARLLTTGIALRDDWQAMRPQTMVGVEFEGLYVGSHDPGSGRVTFMLDPSNPTGFYPASQAFVSAHRDLISDALFFANAAGSVQKWGEGVSSLTASHTSRAERTGAPVNFAFGQVVADSYPVSIDIWAQGAPVVTGLSVTGPRPFRLPSGFRADQWQVKITTTGAPVQAALLATSSAELNVA